MSAKAHLVVAIDTQSMRVVGVSITSSGPGLLTNSDSRTFAQLDETTGESFHEAAEQLRDVFGNNGWFDWLHPLASRGSL